MQQTKQERLQAQLRKLKPDYDVCVAELARANRAELFMDRIVQIVRPTLTESPEVRYGRIAEVAGQYERPHGVIERWDALEAEIESLVAAAGPSQGTDAG